MTPRLLPALLLSIVLLSACSKLETVKNETTEAVNNLQNEASELKADVDAKVEQVNTAVDSVENAVNSVNQAIDNVKTVTGSNE